jgi:hypothetical protein
MESYSHTTVPSRLSTRLLSNTRACIPEDKVMLLVNSFILANSSCSVILYKPRFTVAVIVHGAAEEHGVGHSGPDHGLNCTSAYNDFPV